MKTDDKKPPEVTRVVTRTGEIWLLALDGVTWNYWGQETRAREGTRR